VKLSPLDYLLIPFTDGKQDLFQGSLGGQEAAGFPDLHLPVWVAAAILLVLQIVIYNVQTRRLHRHEPLVTMQEWFLWTGLATFGLVLVEATFGFYFVFVLLTLGLGLAAYLWIRFVRFPPLIAAYNNQLRRARSFSQQRYRHPEATLRRRKAERTKRRRR
jgi:hypothetical protein